jgi:membrane protein DedA with SNARE-associated domain
MSRPVPLSRLFALIVLGEVLTMAALYWMGRHFGA